MEIAERRQSGVVVLSPEGRVDNDTSPDFQSRLLAAVGAEGAAVLVDLAGVEYMSSAGLRALMAGARQSKAKGGRLAVTGLRPVVREIFAISRFSYVVRVFETPAEAMLALGAPDGAQHKG